MYTKNSYETNLDKIIFYLERYQWLLNIFYENNKISICQRKPDLIKLFNVGAQSRKIPFSRKKNK